MNCTHTPVCTHMYMITLNYVCRHIAVLLQNLSFIITLVAVLSNTEWNRNSFYTWRWNNLSSLKVNKNTPQSIILRPGASRTLLRLEVSAILLYPSKVFLHCTFTHDVIPAAVKAGCLPPGNKYINLSSYLEDTSNSTTYIYIGRYPSFESQPHSTPNSNCWPLLPCKGRRGLSMTLSYRNHQKIGNSHSPTSLEGNQELN